jgi:hypothetical protein
MLVKKTKSGKVTMMLSLHQRDSIWTALIGFLESESVEVSFLKVTTDTEVMRVLYYHSLAELIRKDFQLNLRMNLKWTVTMSQAVALMWLLRSETEEMGLIDLKSGIHKLLHS